MFRLARTVPPAGGGWVTDQFRVRFKASDLGSASNIEAAIDAFAIVECEIEPSCDDDISNQGEQLIDCGGPCPPCECLFDDDCVDKLFCNGEEYCDPFGLCAPGDDPLRGGGPCPGQFCNEAADTCFECLSAADCDDGVDCTVDTCELNACAHTPDDSFCDSSLHCAPRMCDAVLGCRQAPDPCPGMQCDEGNGMCVGPGRFLCQLSTAVASASSSVEMDLFLTTTLGLAEYGVAIEITRTSGGGEVTVDCPPGVAIDTSRQDYVFAGAGLTLMTWDCDDPLRGGGPALANALFSGSVDVRWQPVYLASYTLDISSDALDGSTFLISVAESPGSYLLDDQREPITFITAPACILTIGDCETGPFGDVDRDGQVDVFDIFCVLDGMRNVFASCSFENVDIAPCGGNGVIDIFDIFAVLDAFQSLPTACPGPCLDPDP